MKTTIHCDERITNIRHTIYVKLFWGIIIANELTYLLDYFFKTSLNGWVIPLAPDVLIIWMSIKEFFLMEPNIFHTGVGYLHYAILV